MKLAVIPARGGSKRIPRKNVKLFCGKPMIAWSIEAALESECFDRLVVSTDDDEIAEVATAHGADVPFRRPAQLSDDMATTVAVIAHSGEWFRTEGMPADLICCLYATAPFVRPQDLRDGLTQIEEAQCDYVFSATSYAFPIQRAFKLKDGNRPEMFDPTKFTTRSQDLDEAFHDAGQYYWGRAHAWAEQKPIFSGDSVAQLLPRFRVQDIDTPEDWERAEWMFRQLQASKG